MNRFDSIRGPIEEIRSAIKELEGKEVLHESLLKRVNSALNSLQTKTENLRQIDENIGAIRAEVLKPVTRELETSRKFSLGGLWIGAIGAIASIVALLLSTSFARQASTTVQGLERGLQARTSELFVLENDVMSLFDIRLGVDIGTLDSIDQAGAQWHTKYFFNKNYGDSWRGNTSFERVISLLDNPPAELQPHLSSEIRSNLLLQQPEGEKQYTLIVPEERQLPVIVVKIVGVGGDVEGVSLSRVAADPLSDVIAAAYGPSLEIAAVENDDGSQTYYACMFETERLSIRGPRYDWTIEFIRIFNSMAGRRSPEDGRDAVQIRYAFIPRDDRGALPNTGSPDGPTEQSLLQGVSDHESRE